MLISQSSQSAPLSSGEFATVVNIVQTAIASAHGSVSIDYYEEEINLGEAVGGKQRTGRRTIVIEIDGGDPNVRVDYNYKCCGQ